MAGGDKVSPTFRALYVYGSEERDAARASRSRLISQAQEALARIASGLSKRLRQDPEAVARRVVKTVSNGHVGDWLRTELNIEPEGPHASFLARSGRAGRHRSDATVSKPWSPTWTRVAARPVGLNKDQALSESAHHFFKKGLFRSVPCS